MQASPLSLTARTLYAELREMALAVGLREPLGKAPGSVVQKSLKGRSYLYYQHRDLAGHTRQTYLGPDEARTRELAEKLIDRSTDHAEDMRRLDELRAAFVAAGGYAMEHAPMRVLRGFADAGVLQPHPGKAVLIGTHAFNLLGNLLGVRWASQMQTQDIDPAGDTSIDLAIVRPETEAPLVLDRLGMGFIPVPTLDPRSPSTSFRVRGKDLRVDLLTPLTGKPRTAPVYVPALNSMAQPLRFLDYLLEDPVPVVALGRSDLLLLNVPAPERFALHKLLVSESRAAAFATKAGKDRLQAAQMLEVLIGESPDGLAPARSDLLSRGKGWTDKFERALGRLRHDYPAVVSFMEQA